jgi:hypothetical protein
MVATPRPTPRAATRAGAPATPVVAGDGPVDLNRPTVASTRIDDRYKAPTPSKPVPACMPAAAVPRVTAQPRFMRANEPRTPGIAPQQNRRTAPDSIQHQWRRAPEPPWRPLPPVHPDPEHPMVIAMRERALRHARKGRAR